jgi:hypothetical protein
VREGLTAAQAELADLMRTRQQRREALRRKQLAVSLLQLYVKQVTARAPDNYLIG